MDRPSIPQTKMLGCSLLLVAACYERPGDDEHSGRPPAVGSDEGDTGDTGFAESDGGSTVRGCGDGELESTEQCDDGNDVDGDGCNRDCRRSGQMLWSTSQAGGFGQNDELLAVADAGGATQVSVGYLTAGAAGVTDAWLHRHDHTGTALWTVERDGPASGGDHARALIVSPNGAMLVGGVEGVPMQGGNAWIAKMDPGGAELWSLALNGSANSNDGVDALLVDPGGDLVAVGWQTVSLEESTDGWIHKMTPDGGPLWTRTFRGPGHGQDRITAAAALEDGSFYLAGWETVTGEGPNAWLARVDLDGNLLWERTVNGSASLGDHWQGVVVAPNSDDAIVCGVEIPRPVADGDVETPRMLLRRYDRDGSMIWTRDYRPDDLSGATCLGLSLDSSEQLVAVGGIVVDGVTRGLVRKYDADGEPGWSHVVQSDSPGPDGVHAVSVASNGDLLLAGFQTRDGELRDGWLGRMTP